MVQRKGPDSLLLVTIGLLLAVGLVMVYSSSTIISLYRYDTSYYYLGRQFLYALAGLVAMYFCMNFSYYHWRKLVRPVFLINLLLLVLVLVPELSASRADAQRWINLGFMHLQPAELTKFALVLFCANYFSFKLDRMGDFKKGLLPVLLVLVLCFFLIMLQPDLGTALAITATISVMIFASGARLIHLLTAGLAAVPPLAALVMVAPYRVGRVLAFSDPWADMHGTGWQVVQSLLAIGAGRWAGVGLGASIQKQLYLPEPWNDFIFAILAEELGFVGGLFVIVLYALLLWRGFRVAMKAPDIFGQFLALGITVMIVVQASINMGVVTGMLPVTGINLPLISYGGSSLVVTLGSLGVLLNISRYCQD